MTNNDHDCGDYEDRKDFLKKVENRRYKTAELVNGNGFIEIRDSWVQKDAEGEDEAWFVGKFQGHFGFWSDKDLTNYCL